MSLSRKCKLSADSFCYVCGLYISLKQVKYKIKLEAKFVFAYESCFGMKIGDQDKSWSPHVIRYVEHADQIWMAGLGKTDIQCHLLS